MDEKMKRALYLLMAANNLLNKQNESVHVLNMLSETVKYDGAECDGFCLMEDIQACLDAFGIKPNDDSYCEHVKYDIPEFEDFADTDLDINIYTAENKPIEITDLTVVTEPFHALPCELETFTINGQLAELRDFGSCYKHDREHADSYCCENRYFEGYDDEYLKRKAMKKYDLTEYEYLRVIDILTHKLAVGSCACCR